MVEQQYACWREELLPALAANGIRLLELAELDPADLAWLEDYYRTQVRPVLTPLAIDPAHPFPQLLNKSLNLIVRLEMARNREVLKHMAVVQIPRILPRMVKLPRADARQDYVYLGRLIGHYLADLFPGTKLLGYWPFRVTRNSELYIDEEETANLLKAVENELHNRRKGDAVRLEIDHECPQFVRDALLKTLRLTEDDLYLIDGPLNPTRLMALSEGDHSPELRDPPFVAPVAAQLRERPDLFAAIRERDILLHHPYENFDSVVEFLEQAASDPDVLAIKQTLYRTGGDPRIVGALKNAVQNGKQVTAVVELRARFDEANNIQWARQLEEAGVHVVYGLVGYKIHAKSCLVVRREGHTSAATCTWPPAITIRPPRGFTPTSACSPAARSSARTPPTSSTCSPASASFRACASWWSRRSSCTTALLQLIERETENARQGSARAHHPEDQFAGRAADHRGALPRVAGGGEDRPDRARHLLPAAGPQGRQREHHRAQHRGPVPRAQPHLLFRERLPAGGVRRQRGLDAAQFLPAHRAGLPDRGRHPARADHQRGARDLPGGQCQGPRSAAGRLVSAGDAGRGWKAHRSQFEFLALANGAENASLKPRAGKPAYPRVKLAPSPFASQKTRR